MKTWKMIGMILIIIGGINWGLIGFFDYNLIDSLFGAGSMTARTIYGIVGIVSLIMLIGMVAMPMKMMDEKSNKKY